jgi:hypothetical protein
MTLEVCVYGHVDLAVHLFRKISGPGCKNRTTWIGLEGCFAFEEIFSNVNVH